MGYAQMGDYIRGNLSLEQAKERILLDHLHLAKKQKTWIRGMMS